LTTSAPDPTAEEAAADATAQMLRIEQAQAFSADDVTAPAAQAPPQQRTPSPWSQPVPEKLPPNQPLEPRAATQVSVGTYGSSRMKPRVLEDLYTHYTIGPSHSKLRVRRVEPKTWQGRPIAGWLRTEVVEPVSQEDFADYFGGGKYEVLVMGPARGKNAGDPAAAYEAYYTMPLELPGTPNPDVEMMSEEEYLLMMPQRSGFLGMPTRQPMFQPIPPVEPPDVAMQRMKIEAAERERDERRRDDLVQRAQPNADVVGAMRDHSEKTIDWMRKEAAEKVELLRGQAEAMRTRLEEVEKRLQDEQRRRMEAENAAAQSLRTFETDKTRELETKHSKEISDLKDRSREDLAKVEKAYTQQITELKDRYQHDLTTTEKASAGQIADLKDRHGREIQEITARAAKDIQELGARNKEENERRWREWQEQLQRQQGDYTTRLAEYDSRRIQSEVQAAQERERLRGEALGREQQIKDTYQLQMTALKDNYESRLRDKEDSVKRELATVNAERDREVASIVAQAQMQDKFSEKTTAVQLTTTHAELDRLRADVTRLERQNDDLRKEQNKPFPQALAEAKEVAEMIGFGPQEPAEAAEEKPLDWKQMIAGVVQTAVKQLPETLDKLKEVRAQGAATAQAAGPPAAAGFPDGGPPPLMPRMRRRQLAAPPPQQYAVSQAYPPAPPLAPPSAGRQPSAVVLGNQIPGTSEFPVSGAQDLHLAPSPLNEPPPQPTAVQPAPQQPSAPLWQPQQAAPQPAAAAMPIAPQQGWTPPPQPPAAPTAAPAQRMPAAPSANIPPEAAMQFVNELERHYREGMVTPRMFAEGVVAEIGAPTVAQLLASLPVERFILEVLNLPNAQQISIATRSGQKFVREVWAEAGAIVRAAGAAV